MVEPDTSTSKVPRHLLEVARSVLSDLDLESVLGRILEAAREVCGARYAALGLLDDSRHQLARFVTVGIDEATRARIGALPRGRGVLGEVIEHPVPLRLPEVSAHPHSYGFPAGHPPMASFLGVPVHLNDEPIGNLYLTEKIGADEFTSEDELSLVMLAAFAGVAIDHARRYSELARQRRELQRTVAALDATVQIALAVGGETDLGVILELVAKRGRALVSARTLVIELVRDNGLYVAAAAGELGGELLGRPLDATNSLAGLALRRLATLRLEDEPNLRRFQQHGLGRLGFTAEAGLVVPLVFRGRQQGVLIAIDRLEDGPAFGEEDRRLLEAFAASAATAVATARTVEADLRSQRLAATEEERGRWARELHDETLQNLAALRLGLSAQLRADDLPTVRLRLAEQMQALDEEITSLRALIVELRPTALDDLGLGAALEDLANRAAARGLDVDLDVDLAYERGRCPDRHIPELETALYRVIQEALTNAIKHGNAERASVIVRDDDHAVTATVSDDGDGFDPSVRSTGFGMTSMRERAELIGGTLEVSSTLGSGTTVQIVAPTQRRPHAIAS